MNDMDTAKDRTKSYFSRSLVDWFRLYQRDLPWRRSKNPYYIWISEIMLQQTRVDTVIPYFLRFIERFPTIEALADAPEEDVLKLWEGLGYYSRARNLQAAARQVKTQFGGQVPSRKEEVSSLKGVGPYTTGAILSIAYNQSEPAVDGNVMRVLSRYFLIEDDIMKPSTRSVMEKLIYELIPDGEASDFNQGLMELGALVCTPRSPYCLTCPVMEHCAGRLAGVEQSLPVKKKAKPPRPERRAAALVIGSGEQEGCFLVRRRPEEGLLAKMWELPHYLLPEAEAASAAAAAKDRPSGFAGLPAAEPLHFEPQVAERSDADVYGHQHAAYIGLTERQLLADGISIHTGSGQWFMQTEHIFSHIRWDMEVYRFDALPAADENRDGYRWIRFSDMDKLAFPNVFLRIIQAYAESGWIMIEKD